MLYFLPGKVVDLNLAFSLSSVELMPVDSEREEELQEECGLSQLETRFQHGSDHVCSPEVWTLTG